MSAPLDTSIYNALSELGFLDQAVLDQVYQTSQSSPDTSLYQLLLHQDLVSDENLGKLIADLYEVPMVRLKDLSIDPKILHLIPETVAASQEMIAFKQDDAGIHLGMSNPKNMQQISFLGKKYRLPIVVHYATPQDVQKTLKLYNENIAETFQSLISPYVSKAKNSQAEDPPIIELVNTLLLHGYENTASDIHLELHQTNTVVRFRIDGILHDIATLPGQLHERIITRLKIMAKIRTDEHQSAHDGKIILDVNELIKDQHKSNKLGNNQLDIRVSIVPVTSGEKAVLRLLTEGSRHFSLESIGFNKADSEKVTQAYTKPHGMILVTGPTGSGKTTTLYALIKQLNKREINITTIEDPVEYDLLGINQIQVNSKTNLTFPTGLKAIVRQDPDVILVGEIRDKETADVAVNSAMTGHLVLSSLHTNDASTAVPRLVELSIEPFLLSSSLNLVIAQRLVRRVCTQCKVSKEYSINELSKKIPSSTVESVYGSKDSFRAYRGKGCEVCHNTGYRGRMGIFEVLEVTEEIQIAISQKATAKEIEDLAVKNGMTTMLIDGLHKTKKGLTSIEEVMRVTQT